MSGRNRIAGCETGRRNGRDVVRELGRGSGG
jgi:hypothetical protein